jgi:hypothetical protein
MYRWIAASGNPNSELPSPTPIAVDAVFDRNDSVRWRAPVQKPCRPPPEEPEELGASGGPPNP